MARKGRDCEERKERGCEQLQQGRGGTVKSYGKKIERLARVMARKERDCEEWGQGRGGIVEHVGKERGGF